MSKGDGEFNPSYSCMEGCSTLALIGGLMLAVAAKLGSNLIKRK
jgi:hypothetical protein